MSTQKTPGCPTTLAAGGGYAFVGVGCSHQKNGTYRFSAAESPAAPTNVLSGTPELTFVNGYLWAVGIVAGHGQNVVAKINPATGEIVSSVHFPRGWGPETIAGDASAIWVIGDRGTTSSGTASMLFEVNPAGNRIVQTIPLDGIRPKGASPHRMIRGLAVGEGAVWLIDAGYSNQGIIVDAYIIRISERTGRVTGEVSVGYTNELAVGDGAVWTSNKNDLGLRIDAKTLKVTQLNAKPFEPFAVGEGGVWYMVRKIEGPDVAIRRLDPKTLKPNLSVNEPSFPSTVGLNPALDPTSHTAWVPSDDNDQLTQIDLHS